MSTEEKEKEELLQQLYYDPKKGLTHAEKLYQNVKDQGIKLQEVKDFVSKQELGQRYRQPTMKDLYPITAPPHSYQADLIFYPKTKQINNGFDTALTLIEVNSRMGYVYPMKGKQTSEVLRVFKQFLDEDKIKMVNLVTDSGSEFISRSFKALMKKHNISHVTADEGDHSKMGMIERFNRTIKALISKYQTSYKTKKWIDAIDDLVDNYNHTVQSGTGYAPSDVGMKEIALIRMLAIRKTRKLGEKKNLNVGDRVRVLERKSLFGKEGPKWSEKVHTIEEDNVKTFTVDGIRRKLKHYELLKVYDPAEVNPFQREAQTFDVEQHLETVRAGRGTVGEERPVTRERTGRSRRKGLIQGDTIYYG